MPKQFKNGLFIFRRDLRINDNNGLNLLNDKCENIYTIFIFTPEQVGESNKFKSNNAVQFMIKSLQDLSFKIHAKGGKLLTFYGHNDTIIEQCIKTLDIDIVCFNIDYSPYAKQRDAKIIAQCEKHKTYVMYDFDYYLLEPDVVKTGSGTPYKMFTPYYENALKHKVQPPSGTKQIHFMNSNAHFSNKITLDIALTKFTKQNNNILVHGGRDEAIHALKQAIKTQKRYSKTRDEMHLSTSLLSAYIKFGNISIREVYSAFKGNKEFIRQLFWRDFYAQVLYYYPHVLGNAMKPSFNKIKWHHNTKWFQAWKAGNTGFPIVDASMRQLNTIGWTHNRGRMICSTFLVKILLISWEEGERYYATKLTDYDPASNNLSWQSSASVGTDSQPYFRTINPWIQSKEHDAECEYIKKWIPELQNVEPYVIHNWFKEYENHKDVKYPQPICDYNKQKDLSLNMYKNAI